MNNRLLAFALLTVATFVALPAWSQARPAIPAAPKPGASALPPAEAKESVAPTAEPPVAAAPSGGPERELNGFEVGFFLNAAMPRGFSGDDSQNFGVGFGYGFSFGWRLIPHLTLQARLEGLFHSIDYEASADNDFASLAGIGVGTKVFPLGDSGPRVYGLLGIDMVNYWVHDGFTILPTSGEGATFRGYRYSFGAGYEHSLMPNLALHAELDFTRTVLTKQSFEDGPSVSLAPDAKRWAPTLRIGGLFIF